MSESASPDGDRYKQVNTTAPETLAEQARSLTPEQRQILGDIIEGLELTPNFEGKLLNTLAEVSRAHSEETSARIRAETEAKRADADAVAARKVAEEVSRREADRFRLAVSIVLLIIFATVSILGVVGWILGKDVSVVLPIQISVGTLTGAVISYYFAKK